MATFILIITSCFCLFEDNVSPCSYLCSPSTPCRETRLASKSQKFACSSSQVLGKGHLPMSISRFLSYQNNERCSDTGLNLSSINSKILLKEGCITVHHEANLRKFKRKNSQNRSKVTLSSEFIFNSFYTSCFFNKVINNF